MTGQPDGRIRLALFEGLTYYDPRLSSRLPALAKSWTSRTRIRLYTFHLRHDARWSNGDTVTAHDFYWW